jgi:hypothetical protein
MSSNSHIGHGGREHVLEVKNRKLIIYLLFITYKKKMGGRKDKKCKLCVLV